VRPDSLRTLCLAAFLAALCPTPAGAATNSVFLKSLCADMTTIPPMYQFQTDFVGVPNCQKLCSQAVAACQRAVKDAANCELAFASDWVTFDSAVTCTDDTGAPLKGADLSACKASWADDKKAWQALVKVFRGIEIQQCAGTTLSTCQLRCTGQ
jgi:hypothetical protein